MREFYILFFTVFLLSSSLAEETFLSLKKNKVNVRYGPSFDSDIKYIYNKINLPVKQIDKKENFRRIIDFKNNSGWIHISQLKKNSSVIAKKEIILFANPTLFSKPVALIKKGKLLIIEKCQKKWCQIVSDTYEGWIINKDIWGSY
ncbi:MAG: hypothetical protein CNC05_00045 [Pelagibacterales bacterium MED-G42]|nr:MAG: hypothetical protein CNC05_00045 [Pelagibacterales bacterium MED-G42]|tara:strand:- start:387 stop:824 length:438 start_codon:yes stop_codon:yes gene_type:complete